MLRRKVVSLGRGLVLHTWTGALAEAARRIAALHPNVHADDLLRRMTSVPSPRRFAAEGPPPAEYCTSLRGKLLLVEIACCGLGEPCVFYLLGAAGDVVWHGARIRLFLFGLYRPDEIRRYLAASMGLYQEVLSPENIRSWLEGRSWPDGAHWARP